MIPSYQADLERDELAMESPPKRKRTRRSKLDMRIPADFVPEEQRVKVAAVYWLLRQHQHHAAVHGKVRDWRNYEALIKLLDVADKRLFTRFPWRASMFFTSWKAPRPAPCEVAACCWSVTTSAAHLYSFYSHVNSAAHLAQHFRVDTQDVIHEARALKVVMALMKDDVEA